MEVESNVKTKRLNNIQIENRKKASVSGVLEVLNFTETAVACAVTDAHLVVSGTGLKIAKFSVEEGVLVLEGIIDAVKYIAAGGEKKGFFKRLIK